jgi:hypothetical protein
LQPIGAEQVVERSLERKEDHFDAQGCVRGGSASNLLISDTSLIPRAEEAQNFIQESAFLGGLTWLLKTPGKSRRGQSLLGNFVVRMDNQLRQFVGRLDGWWEDSKGRQHLDLVLSAAEANSDGQNNQRR